LQHLVRNHVGWPAINAHGVRETRKEITMKCWTAAVSIILITLSTATAYADAVTDWNQTALEVLKAGNIAGNPWSRAMAMVHVAMSDAINSVQGRYTRYVATAPVAPNVSADAAAAAAAREILIQLVPAQRTKIDEAYADSLSRIPDGPAKRDGIILGEQVAALVQADRATDATNAPDTYRPITSPGVWVPTQPPLFPQYAQAKPWGMKSADQFRPSPPPLLTSAIYARDYNETKELGGSKSAKRTQQQTDVVRFWTQSNFGPSWNDAARQLSAGKGLSLADNGRLFALLAMGIADSFILDWDAKFHYSFWRPVTAIRNGDRDGNDATERDASWSPLNVTPMHPEYPSQAAIQCGAAAGILEAVFGTGPVPSFTATDTVDARLQRQFTSIGQMAEEQRLVRIWGGIHFRNTLEISDQMGRRIASHLMTNYVTPAR
jgi:hypothetical protein